MNEDWWTQEWVGIALFSVVWLGIPLVAGLFVWSNEKHLSDIRKMYEKDDDD